MDPLVQHINDKGGLVFEDKTILRPGMLISVPRNITEYNMGLFTIHNLYKIHIEDKFGGPIILNNYNMSLPTIGVYLGCCDLPQTTTRGTASGMTPRVTLFFTGLLYPDTAIAGVSAWARYSAHASATDDVISLPFCPYTMINQLPFSAQVTYSRCIGHFTEMILKEES